MQPLDEALVVGASIASSLRLRLIARRSPSASPTLKAGERHRDVEHLLLEDDRPERLWRAARAAIVLDRVDEVGVLAQRLAPFDVGVDGLPWIGPGRTSATCTVRSSRSSGRVRSRHLHLRPALDLEEPDRVGLLDLE